MTPVKSRARKQDLGLTISQATRDARKVVNATMPDVDATVDSRYGHDLANDVPTVITTITFPATADASDVACWAERVPGVITSTWSPVRITVTRKR